MTKRKPEDSIPSSEPALDELVRLAQDLDLTALAEAFQDLLADAEKLGQSYSDFARAMLYREWLRRRERKLSRGLKRSRLGTIEGLDGFNFAARPQLEPRVVKET